MYSAELFVLFVVIQRISSLGDDVIISKHVYLYMKSKHVLSSVHQAGCSQEVLFTGGLR